MDEKTGEKAQPILKYVNRHWKRLPDDGDDVSIRDPRLKQGYLGDLSKKSVIELEETLWRLDRVLKNKLLRSRLRDQGQELLKRRQEIDEILRLAYERDKELDQTTTLSDVNAFEWMGRMRHDGKLRTASTVNYVGVDEELDEYLNEKLDPLKLMAYHASCVKAPPRPTAQPEEDPADAILQELKLLEIQDKMLSEKHQDFGVKRDQILERKHQINGPAKESFKPFRPVSNPKPIPGVSYHVHSGRPTGTKCISQQTSIRLEKQYLRKQAERTYRGTIHSHKLKKEWTARLPLGGCSRYRDTNLEQHLLDLDDDDLGESTLQKSDDEVDESDADEDAAY